MDVKHVEQSVRDHVMAQCVGPVAGRWHLSNKELVCDLMYKSHHIWLFGTRREEIFTCLTDVVCATGYSFDVYKFLKRAGWLKDGQFCESWNMELDDDWSFSEEEVSGFGGNVAWGIDNLIIYNESSIFEPIKRGQNMVSCVMHDRSYRRHYSHTGIWSHCSWYLCRKLAIMILVSELPKGVLYELLCTVFIPVFMTEVATGVWFVAWSKGVSKHWLSGKTL